MTGLQYIVNIFSNYKILIGKVWHFNNMTIVYDEQSDTA